MILSSCDLAHHDSNESDERYDILIKNGIVYDGSGTAGFEVDIGIIGDAIVKIGNLKNSTAVEVIDANGLAVSPGFINMLSWAPATLIQDGRGLSDLKQGVTLEVFGEGWSMGPLTDSSIESIEEIFGPTENYDVEWSTLGEFLDWLVERGVSSNVASFVGATTLRINHVGYSDRKATSAELYAMRQDVEFAMKEGALGVSSALIYPPGIYADTEELISLAEIASKYSGIYATHMRSEGSRLLEALDETINIAKRADVHAHIFHLKAAGDENWTKIGEVIARINSERESGIGITADVYPYQAAATSLLAMVPPWALEGSFEEFVARAKDPKQRMQIISEMRDHSDEWEQYLHLSGGPDGVVITNLSPDTLKPFIGMRLSEISRLRNAAPEEVVLDLIIGNGAPGFAAYDLISEKNLKSQLKQPWVAIGSDAEAVAPTEDFFGLGVHPRAYGAFARILAGYARDDSVFSLSEAIRRMSSLPASILGLKKRGYLRPGYFADIVIFNPEAIQDHATYEDPHQFASGVRYVLVNGAIVIKNGEHTGVKSGRVVRGPGHTLSSNK